MGGVFCYQGIMADCSDICLTKEQRCSDALFWYMIPAGVCYLCSTELKRKSTFCNKKLIIVISPSGWD